MIILHTTTLKMSLSPLILTIWRYHRARHRSILQIQGSYSMFYFERKLSKFLTITRSELALSPPPSNRSVILPSSSSQKSFCHQPERFTTYFLEIVKAMWPPLTVFDDCLAGKDHRLIEHNNFKTIRTSKKRGGQTIPRRTTRTVSGSSS